MSSFFECWKTDKLHVMRIIGSICLVVVTFLLQAQSPEEIVKKVGENFIQRSSFELTEKPLPDIQQGILVMRPTRMDALDVETIVSVNEFGRRYLNIAANPGRIKVWRDDEVVFDGRSTTKGTPKVLDAGLYQEEFKYLLPGFPGDYQIRIEYYPEGATTAIFLWITDENGSMQYSHTFRSDWDFVDTYLYKFKSRTSESELDWEFPTTSMGLQFDSPLGMNDWEYTTGMMLDAMWKASDQFASIDFKEFVEDHMDFFLENIDKVLKEKESSGAIQSPFYRYFRYQQLDDFGPQTVPFFHLPENDTRKRFISKGLNRILYRAIRLNDGAFARVTPDSLSLWSEDLYMGTVLLCRAFGKNKSQKYLQEAIKQTILYNQKLKDRKTRLYAHGFFAENVQQSSTKWARANALVILANVELLRVIPESHPERESILRIYRSHASSLRDMQSLDGRWYQVLNSDSSYLETSASAMIVAAFAEGLKNDWMFNKAEFRQSVLRGWIAITEQIDEKGNVNGISPHTPILYSDKSYAALEPVQNHPAGLAAILYAAMAIDQLQLE